MLHLSNIRLLFIADKPTLGQRGDVALASFDIPLRCVHYRASEPHAVARAAVAHRHK